MNTSSTPLHHRPELETYLTPRWAIAGLCLGWPEDVQGPIWDPAAGGDSGYTVGEMLADHLASRRGGVRPEVILSDLRATGHPGVEVADFEACGPADGLSIVTNPPFDPLDRWLDLAVGSVGPDHVVAFLVPCLYLSSWGDRPSGRARWHGLRRVVRLCGAAQAGRNISGRVEFELLEQEAISRMAVNIRWHKGEGPAALRSRADEYLSSPAGGWVEGMSPPSRPLAVKAIRGSATGYGLGRPATDHCWAIWYGDGCTRPEEPPVRVTRLECDELLARLYGEGEG